MRVAVITDIHANLAALEATLAAIDARGCEEIWCLGDVLGYGAEPDECASIVRERCAVCLAGNHDLAVLGDLDISAFSSAAAEAAAWTRERISEATLRHLDDLEPSCERAGFGLYHASPRDPIWEYVLSAQQAEACFDLRPGTISLIGHSHVALYFRRLPGAEAEGAQAGDGEEVDLTSGEWLLNPGSVGQPCDGDPRAAWLELETEPGRASFHRVAYDTGRSAAAIVAAGLPRRLAERLIAGQ